MSGALLSVQGIGKCFGGFVALQNVSFALKPGEKLGIIGPNGSGKTTLINCISGSLRNDQGQVLFDGRDVSKLDPHQRLRRGIARSFQIPRPFHRMSVIENLYVPLEYNGDRSAAAAGSLREQAYAILEKFGIAAKADARSGSLSQVELRKLELARAIAGRPRLLVSDEALAGLSTHEVDEVLDILFRLADEGITVIMIEHIMRAIMRFSDTVICLVAGQLIASGTPGDIVKNPDVEKAYFGG